MTVSLSRTGMFCALLSIALLTACASPSNNNTYAGGGGGGGGGTDAASGADGGGGSDAGGSTAGDNTKNTASVNAKDEAGKTTEVKNDKAATKSDASGKVLGASNAGDVLTLFVTDGSGSGTVLVVHIDSKKHPLPAKGIPVGEPATDVYVTYTSAGGVYNSKSTGTIDIDVCPEKDGVAVVGKFNGVVVHNVSPVGNKTVTLDGTFNLVYFGGAGALTCKKKETGGGGGKVDLGSFGKPAASTCDANPCDGGTNDSRTCCPYVPCLNTCFTACVKKVQGCVMGCGMDMSCPQKCMAEVFVCQAKCPVTCEVSAVCSSAIEKLNKCEAANASACQGEDEDKSKACLFDKCCAEMKAAF